MKSQQGRLKHKWHLEQSSLSRLFERCEPESGKKLETLAKMSTFTSCSKLWMMTRSESSARQCSLAESHD